ncbi:MAG: DUF4097 family beta strand repeat protein [Candidatus Krumholzibacteriota bacterium]|nr:DUF4097 family beta strand repeat protein [Candidatus Krumholzibacteriota bacterium]
MRSRWIYILLILTVFVPSTLSAYRLTEIWEKNYEVEEGALFILQNVNGSIDVEGYGGDRIEVVAEIRIKAASKDKAKKILRKIEFDVEHERGLLRIEADLPKLKKEGLFGLLGSSGPSIAIRYRVRVPKRTDVELRSVNGRVASRSVKGTFLLKTVNGGIGLHSLGGEGTLGTVNGGIDCAIEQFDSGAELSIKSVNGSVKLELPEDAGAELDIKTLNGKIRTDFELNRVRRIKRSRIEGSIGDGDGYINIRTTNGGVTVRSI